MIVLNAIELYTLKEFVVNLMLCEFYLKKKKHNSTDSHWARNSRTLFLAQFLKDKIRVGRYFGVTQQRGGGLNWPFQLGEGTGGMGNGVQMWTSKGGGGHLGSAAVLGNLRSASFGTQAP